MLTLMPAATNSRKASTPAAVAGTLIMALGWLMACHKRLPSATVPAASCAKLGDTSKLTMPAWPLFAW